jgi:hypothetical protein
MKFKAYTYIIKPKSKLLKPYIIDKVIGETHAKQLLRDNIKIKYPGRRYKLISLTEIR